MDEFIGQTFNDGKLTVVGWNGERQSGNKLYSCHCSECAKDPELHGNAIFKSLKSSLVNGRIPCGCSKQPKWSAVQYRVLLKRKAEGKYSAVVPEGAKASTNVSCRCNADGCGHEWEAQINNLLNNDTTCNKCRYKAQALPEDVAVENVLKICSEKNFQFIGFKGGWNGVQSKLLLTCHCGRAWGPKYNGVVYIGTGCPDCGGGGYDSSKPGTFYCYLWENKETKDRHLKYGISNVPTNRIRNQRRANANYTARQLCSIDFTDGKIPERLERAIDEYKRNNNIPSPVTKLEFPDGWTETLPISAWHCIANLVFQTTMCRITPLQQ